MSCLDCGTDTEGGEFCPKCGKSVGVVVSNLRKVEPIVASIEPHSHTKNQTRLGSPSNKVRAGKAKQPKVFALATVSLIALAVAGLVLSDAQSGPTPKQAHGDVVIVGPTESEEVSSNPTEPKIVSQPIWGMPRNCKLPGIADKYPNYEFRNDIEIQEAGELACTMLTGTEDYLTFRFRSVSQTFEEYQAMTAEGHSLNGYGQLSEPLQIDGYECNAYTIYTYPGEAIPVYWSHIFCDGASVEIIGNEFDPETYKSNEFLVAIASKMKKG